MRQAVETLVEQTDGQGFYDVTGSITAWLRRQGFETGLITVFCQHTSASLAITENASPAVQSDALRFLARLAPEDERYEHAEEGPDDMPAHLRALVTQTSLSIPVESGRLALGTWQGIFLVEHRRRPHRRRIVVHGFGI
jgi:secondary thiamine-phosphate synthase enzyme